MCGDQIYSLLWSSVVRLEVPPGKYWCRTGAAASKPLKKVKPDDLFPIDAKAGESYYLQVALGTRQFVLQTVTAQAAVDLIADAEITADISLVNSKPEQLERLKAQPPAK